MSLKRPAEDQRIACKDCNEVFIFTSKEQAQFEAKGFAAKVRCSTCTKAKKARFSDPADAKAGGKTLAQTRCFNCGKSGHTSRDCTKPQGSTACFVCGEEGHTSRSCPKAPVAGPARCFNCGMSGHLAQDCQVRPKVEGACYRCGKTGHTSRYCNAEREVDATKVDALVQKRKALCEAKAYDAANEVKKELRALGVTVIDTEGHRWYVGKNGKGDKAKAKPPKPVGLCFAFQRGECARGDGCHFRHEWEASAAGEGGGGTVC